MIIKAMPVTEENIKPFGRYEQIMKGEARTGTGGWRAWTTPDVTMDDEAHFGFVKVGGMPFEVDSMERHTKTTELMMSGDKPFVVALANSAPDGEPLAEDIRAFIVQPGEYIVIDRGIWHDACRSAQGDGCYYYFLSLETDEKAVFRAVQGGMVSVEL